MRQRKGGLWGPHLGSDSFVRYRECSWLHGPETGECRALRADLFPSAFVELCEPTQLVAYVSESLRCLVVAGATDEVPHMRSEIIGKLLVASIHVRDAEQLLPAPQRVRPLRRLLYEVDLSRGEQERVAVGQSFFAHLIRNSSRNNCAHLTASAAHVNGVDNISAKKTAPGRTPGQVCFGRRSGRSARLAAALVCAARRPHAPDEFQEAAELVARDVADLARAQ